MCGPEPPEARRVQAVVGNCCVEYLRRIFVVVRRRHDAQHLRHVSGRIHRLPVWIPIRARCTSAAMLEHSELAAGKLDGSCPNTGLTASGMPPPKMRV